MSNLHELNYTCFKLEVSEKETFAPTLLRILEAAGDGRHKPDVSSGSLRFPM